jgi:peptidoglycan/xylan/chitin deacetylase (PgdA/CDA1 family)
VAGHELGLSVDLDEWYHSRRWVDGRQAHEVPDTTALFRRLYGRDRPAGELIGPTRALLDLFDRHRCRVTFFVLGEVAEWYPDLVQEIAGRGHEIACHGHHHVDMTVLGPERFARELARATATLEALTGQRAVGYRAPNLVYASWATRILEDQGFVYDATVSVSRPIGGKYRGWSHAPIHPYRPSYDDVARSGAARLVELPLPPFPVLRLAAGSGILTRICGFSWTSLALRSASRTGTTMFYFHPWEVGPPPRPAGHALKNAIFLRRTGPWMMRAVEKILEQFAGRILTAKACAEKFIREERRSSGE